MIKTRFAPSPTGYLHIGGARTAIFCWAYAKKHGGIFILRVEDTDLERSTQESVQAILDGMHWLGLDCDEGPFFQMQRLHRYKEVADELLKAGHAYYCYCSKEELDAMREAQRSRGEKPRYDGRWRDSKEKPPAGVIPVLRFKNPLSGEVTWDDQVKGLITIGNSELDDLVLMRGDGVPTYNFGVVVDDINMSITNVIRGDDHVNNTPRQINIYKALGATLPKFAHLPMILGSDGERLSKRHGAVSVMQYRDEGYLADALVNYLARLGWSHGDEEKFSRDQLVEWFDLAHISRSPARFAPEKLQWLNNLYIRDTPDEELADLVEPLIIRSGGDSDDSNKLVKAIGLVKGRAQTINALAEECMLFFHRASPAADLIAQHVTAELRPVLSGLVAQLEELAPWDAATIAATLKQTLAAHKIKMPQLAMPLRVLVFGRTKTPDIANALAIVGKSEVAARIRAYV